MLDQNKFQYLKIPSQIFWSSVASNHASYLWEKHFFTKRCHRQTYQNYEQPSLRLQNSVFLSASKINQIFLIFWYWTRRPTFTNEIFRKLLFLKYIPYFLKMCPIFVSFVHNFGRSDNDVISSLKTLFRQNFFRYDNLPLGQGIDIGLLIWRPSDEFIMVSNCLAK